MSNIRYSDSVLRRHKSAEFLYNPQCSILHRHQTARRYQYIQQVAASGEGRIMTTINQKVGDRTALAQESQPPPTAGYFGWMWHILSY
jgi:hypothetical protein